MANEILSTLLFSIETNTAQLKKGLDDAKNQFGGLSQGISKIKGVIAGAFAVTAIVGAAKAVFDFGKGLDDVASKLDDLGVSMNLAADAGRVKAIADTFDVDLNRVIEAAKATSQQFGVSFSDALNKVQQGLALAGPQSEKYLKALESQSAAYANVGGNADQFFTIVTNGYRTSSAWEKQLQAGVLQTGQSFDDLTAQMNEGQIIQQRLVDSQAAFNAEIANLFADSGDRLDEWKAIAYELGLKAFQTVKKAIVDTINYFIDLYNNSLLFRAVVQSIILGFKQTWEAVKLVGNIIFDVFSTAGKLIKAVFTGNFEEIPDILKGALNSALDDWKTFGENSADNFIDAVQGTLTKEKIQWINETDVQDQANKAASIIKKAITPKADDGMRMELDEPKALSPLNLDPNATNTDGGTLTKLTEQKAAVVDLKNEYQSLGDTIGSQIGGVAVDAFSAMGEMIVGTNDKSKKSFGQMVVSVLQGILKIIQAYLASAIAAVIASESKKGLFGLALAAVGVAAVSAMFKKLVPKFEAGGTMTSSGIAMVGEAGAELVNLPAGTRVSNNAETNRMLATTSTNNLNITVQGMIRGNDIWFINQEQERIRSNTR